MAFVHWSRDEVEQADMDTVNEYCDKCGSEQNHTFRVYVKKTKHYSKWSFGEEFNATIICHGCLLESKIPEDIEKQVIKQFQLRLKSQEGFDLIEKNDFSKAEKVFQVILKDEPGHMPSIEGYVKCLMQLGKVELLKKYVNAMSQAFPEMEQMQKLKQDLEEIVNTT